jgi:hypothetical protein
MEFDERVKFALVVGQVLDWKHIRQQRVVFGQ